MYKNAKSISIKVVTLIALTIMASGCAASRSVVSLDQPSSNSGNPEHGKAIKIVKVSDDRIFEASPKNPDTPSLHDEDINNSSIKARAIGRKRGGFGMAMGDVLLPEDQTVAGMFENALANDFREANYRVLTPGDAGYESATPVQVHVIQFWSWFQPGFLEVKVHNRSEVKITGSLPALKNGLTVRGQATESMMAVTEDDWQNISSEGLKDFSQNLAKDLTSRP